MKQSTANHPHQSHDPGSTSWTHKLWDKVLFLANSKQSPDFISQVDSKVKKAHSLVWCQAYLSTSPSGSEGGVGLVVTCSRDRVCSGSEGYQLIGGNTQPYSVEHGCVEICLRSGRLEADTESGEGQSLCKHWQCEGQGADWHFVLKLKAGFRLEGILGKVIIRTVKESGTSQTLGEFNLLCPSDCHRTSSPLSSDDVWMSLGYRELAESLGILGEDSAITSLCHELGFTDHESEAIHSSPDPFLSLVSQYRSRHGTPREFIQKIYQCKRHSYVNPFTNSLDGEPQLQAQISNISSATVQVSDETVQVEDLTEAACLLQTPPSRKRHLGDLGGIIPKRPCLRLDFTSAENDKECDAETLPAEDLEMHVFPPTPRKFDIPPTPPLTPLKRLTSLARDRKCPFINKGDNFFVFPEKSA